VQQSRTISCATEVTHLRCGANGVKIAAATMAARRCLLVSTNRLFRLVYFTEALNACDRWLAHLISADQV